MQPFIRPVYTPKAPTPGFYCQAIAVNTRKNYLLFVSGQTGNDPDVAGEGVVVGGVFQQTAQALKNILAIVEAAGGSIHSLVACDVFIKDMVSPDARMLDREAMNRAYKAFFTEGGRFEEPPARCMVWVPEVPLESPREETVVEIRAIAAIPYGGLGSLF